MAKLRIHTDETLAIMDKVTASLGSIIRTFVSKFCSAYDTRELPREAAARKRRLARKTKAKGENSGKDSGKGQDASLSRNMFDNTDLLRRCGPVPKTKAFQPTDLQAPLTRGLYQPYSKVWHNGFLLYGICKCLSNSLFAGPNSYLWLSLLRVNLNTAHQNQDTHARAAKNIPSK
jgi:hypothetical protein